MDEFNSSVLTYTSTRRSAFEESASQPHAFSSHLDPTPAEKEYQFGHFNTNSIYLKHNPQTDDFFRCPQCGHLLTSYAETRLRQGNEHLLSYNSPRASPSKCNLVKRRLSSLFRPKYITTIKEKVDQPWFCNVCQRQVMTKYVEQKWCIRPLFNTGDTTPQRPANSSSYKNMIRDHYAKRLPNRSLEISSGTLLTDTESEHFVKSTDYSFRNKIEDDLKQELLKEYFKHKRKHKRSKVYSNSSSSKASSEEFRSFLFKEAKRKFKELNRMSKEATRPKFDQACYTINTTSSARLSKAKGTEAQTVLTQTCCGCSCDCANEYCPSRLKNDKNRVSRNSNIQVSKKSSSKFSLKDSLSKLCSKILNGNAVENRSSNVIRESNTERGVNIVVKKSCVCIEKQAKEANLQLKTKTHETDRTHPDKQEPPSFVPEAKRKDPTVHSGTATELISTFTEKSSILNELNQTKNSRLPANNALKSDTSSHSNMQNKSSLHLGPSTESRFEQQPNSRSARTSGSSETQTEGPYSPPEVSTKQQVMFINNPSCIVVKGGHLHLSRDNIQRPYKKAEHRKTIQEDSCCKNRSKNKCEKSCQCSCGNLSNTKFQTRPAQVVKFESRTKVPKTNFRQCQRFKGACEKDCECQTEQKSALKLFKPRHVMRSVIMLDDQPRRQVDKLIQSVCIHDPPCELVPSCFKVKYKLDLINYCVHVPLCAKVPMCSLRHDEKSRLDDLSSRQFTNLLRGNAGTQVAMVAQTPCMAVQTCNTQRTWLSAYDQLHQTLVEQPPMSATCPTCAHAVSSSFFDGSVTSANTPFIRSQKPKSSFVSSGQNRFMKIFSRHKRST